MMKFLQLILLVSYSSLVIFAQQPSHFKIGENDLSDIDIYNMIQDDESNYWLATNKGIIKYDSYTYENIPTKGASSSSAFDLQMDYNNTIHFKNLSGQIFKITNDTCVLRIQIPDSLMSSQVYYSFDNENNIIIATTTIFKVTENNEIEFFENYDEKNRSYTEPFILKDSSVLIHNHAAKKLEYIKGNSIKSIQLDIATENLFIQSFYLNNELFFYDVLTGKVANEIKHLSSIDSSFIPIKNNDEYLRFHSDNTNLWVARQGGGVKVCDNKLTSCYKDNTFFKNSIISSFLKDNEGNIVLGTFGEGLIILPNLNLSEFKLPDNNVKITRISSTVGRDIFIGTQNGRIYNIDSLNQIKLFEDKEFKNILVLEYIEETNEILVNKIKPTLINISTGKIRQLDFGAIKDVVQVEYNKYMIASNQGVFIFRPNNYSIENSSFSNFRDRTYSVCLNPITNTIYAGTSIGLKIGNEDEASFFTLDDSPLVCSDILYFDNKILVTTKSNGILIFKDDVLVDQWRGENNAFVKSIRQIKSYKDKLILSTISGIKILDKRGNILGSLGKSEGLKSNYIIDFEVINEMLGLVTQNGIQKIIIDSIKPFTFIPTLSIEKVLVNDSLISINDYDLFSYDQNKFEFTIASKNIKYREEINYYYRLIDIDKEWQINTYKDNVIKYKSLPPGKYTFEVKSTCRMNESEIHSYAFIISPPFWSTWWFYLLVSLAIVFVIGLLAYYRIEAINKKNAQILKNKEIEKNAINAQLKALRAQMNPHFIFNSINSIQDLVLQQETIKSYDYLVVFSKLVRDTLDFSEREFISLNEEIKFLETYLSLEKLRFKEDFTYSINIDTDEDILIPSLIIQPFIENAIKHGLLHKDGEKTLNIKFETKDQLICEIVDNGVGREESEIIKKEQNRTYDSFSTSAIKQRMEMLSSQYNTTIDYQIIDLKNESGIAEGTKVIVRLPFNFAPNIH